MKRLCLQFVLEAETPISHAEGVEGNHSLHAMRKQRQPDGSYLSVPIISADTMRHGLRETAAILCLDAAGLLTQEGGAKLSESALRLLFSGGMLTGRGDAGTIKLDRWREICEVLPVVSLMGGCVDAMMIPGKVQCSDAKLICAETAHATWSWAIANQTWAPWSEQMEHCQRVRFDVTRDKHKQFLLSETAQADVHRRLLAKESAHEKADHAAEPEDRGRPMPHSYVAIAAGARLSWEITGANLSDLERSVLLSSLALMFETWRFGGKRGTGHGKLRALSCQDVALPSVSPMASEADVAALSGTAIGVVRAHMQAQRDKLSALLATVDA